MSNEIELNDGSILDMDKDEVYIEDPSGGQITMDADTAVEMAEAIIKHYQT
jgi:hypothetical protein